MNSAKDREDTSLLERTYIQKSRIFLFPLISMKKSKIFGPTNTYISCPDLKNDLYPEGIKDTDRILILNYEKKYKDHYEKVAETLRRNTRVESDIDNIWDNYEMESILSNQYFLAMHETDTEFIYTFDLNDWKYDWDNFLKGRYSLISQSAKDKIINYRWYSLHPKEKRKMMCYLYPNKEQCLQAFAKQLNYSVEELRSVKELCSKPDFRQEEYRCEPINKEEVA